MLVIYPLLGIDAFVQAAPVAATSGLLHLKARGIVAQGRDAAEGFIVSNGSQAAKTETESLHAFIRTQRQALVQNGVLVDSGATLTLVQDYAFTSPSTAAAVLLGRASNGRTEWKDATGKTLKAIREQVAT